MTQQDDWRAHTAMDGAPAIPVEVWRRWFVRYGGLPEGVAARIELVALEHQDGWTSDSGTSECAQVTITALAANGGTVVKREIDSWYLTNLIGQLVRS